MIETGYETIVASLQADAHRGYEALERQHLNSLGCVMHGSCRFYRDCLEIKKLTVEDRKERRRTHQVQTDADRASTIKPKSFVITPHSMQSNICS